MAMRRICRYRLVRAIRPLRSRRKSRALGNDPVGSSASDSTRKMSPASIEQSAASETNARAAPLDPWNGSGPASAPVNGPNTASVTAAPTAIRPSPNRTPSNRCEIGTNNTMKIPTLTSPISTTSMPGTLGAPPVHPPHPRGGTPSPTKRMKAPEQP